MNLGVSINAFIRRGDKLWTRKNDVGVALETKVDGAVVSMILCDEHAISLRDDLLSIYPITASGRKVRSDRKTVKQKFTAAAKRPQARRLLEVLRSYGAGEWQTTRAIAMCVPDITEAVVRSNLHNLKHAGKIESRASDLPRNGPQPYTEWRIK